MTDFHEERRTGIGGSDAAAALGLSPWRTPFDLWIEKLGEGDPLPASEPMRWGKLLEPVIAAEYCRRTGRTIEPAPALIRHPTHPWMIGHIDGRVVDEPGRILEVKTAGIGIGWGEPGTDEIPLQYLTQCHHYLIVSGAEAVDVAVLIGGQDFRLYTIRRDDDIAGSLFEQEYTFWQCVQDRVPPDPVNTADAVRRWGRLRSAGAVTASEIEQQAIERMREIRRIRADLDVEEDAAKRLIMSTLADRGDTLVDLAGTSLATWKLDNGRKGFKVEAREPARRFLLKD
jgi:putative phage-type endonuclease